MIVSVTDATLLMGQTPNPTLQSPLSKLVESSTDLDYLYLSVFSTIRAEAFKATIDTGGTKIEASGAAVSAMESVFLALGLRGTSLTAENLDKMNPLSENKNEAVDLEKAQQSLAKVLNVSDQNGLSGLGQRVAPIATESANKAMGGSEFTAQDFAEYCKDGIGQGKYPAAIVEENETAINGAVRNTFESAPENVTITGTVAYEQSQKVTVDTTSIIGFSVDDSSYVQMFTYSETSAQQSRAYKVKLMQADGTASNTARFNIAAPDGMLVSVDGGSNWDTAYYDQEPGTSGMDVYVKAPAKQAVGRYPVTMTYPGKDLTSTIMVEVLSENTVAMERAELLYGVNNDPDELAFLQMESTSKMEIPEDAYGYFNPNTEGTETAPELWMVMQTVGSYSEMSEFKLKLKMPDGLVIVEGSEEYSYKEATIKTDGTTWELGDDVDWLELKDAPDPEPGKNMKAATIVPAMKIMPAKPLPFGVYTFTMEVTYKEKVVATYSNDMYVLTTKGKTTLAKMEILSYNTDKDTAITEPLVVDVAKHDPDVEPDEVMMYQLHNSTQQGMFRAEAKTWECMALEGGENSDNYTLLQPDVTALYHEESKNNFGGFTTNTSVSGSSIHTSVPSEGMTMVHNLEGTVGIHNATGINQKFLTLIPNATDSANWLAVSVGSNAEMTQLNYEMINMKAWYVEDGDDSEKIQTSSSVQFKSDAN